MHLRGAGNTIITCKNLQVQHTLIRKDLGYWEYHDTQTGMPFGIPKGARCVQRFDDSLNSAIHITYRISLRSSSMREPRDPLLKVVLLILQMHSQLKVFVWRINASTRGSGADAKRFIKCTGCLKEWIFEPGEHFAPRGQLQPFSSNSIMILPQVHLRKPCYDFYFL